jgi:hypothetical protein
LALISLTFMMPIGIGFIHCRRFWRRFDFWRRAAGDVRGAGFGDVQAGNAAATMIPGPPASHWQGWRMAP